MKERKAGASEEERIRMGDSDGPILRWLAAKGWPRWALTALVVAAVLGWIAVQAFFLGGFEAPSYPGG